MKTIRFGPWTFENDPRATYQAYKAIGDSQPKPCDCDGCQNLKLVRNELYPYEVLRFFDRLGLPAGQEPEVYWGGSSNDARWHAYGGINHFVGRVLEGPTGATADNYHRVDEYFELLVNSDLALVPPALAEHPLVQLEFFTYLPWLLDKAPKI